jgi:hypothetical protein
LEEWQEIAKYGEKLSSTLGRYEATLLSELQQEACICATQVLNIFDMPNECSYPGCQAGGTKVCSRCKAASYCSKDHQVLHWAEHKSSCKKQSAVASSASANTFSVDDYKDFPKATQHGTVRLVPESTVSGLATDGMSACIALIFTSSTTGRASLSHTPLKPSREALIQEAVFVGEGAVLTIVPGTTYADPFKVQQYQFPTVLQEIKSILKGIGVEVALYEQVAEQSCVAVKRRGENEFQIICPTGRALGLTPFTRIGYQPHGYDFLDSNNLHYHTLKLEGMIENGMAEGLSLHVEFDGLEWVSIRLDDLKLSRFVAEYERTSGKITQEFLRQCRWTREDGFNGMTCSPHELRHFASNLEIEIRELVRARQGKTSSRTKIGSNKKKNRNNKK